MSTFNAERGCSHVLLDTWVLVTISLWLWTSHHLPDFLFPFPIDKMRGSNELNPQFSWVQLCLTLCDPMDYNTPGLPVHHQLPELTQTHVHRAGEGIQPFHPLSSPSPPACNLSQHLGLFKWEFLASGGQSIGTSASASVLPMNIQDWFPLRWTGLISLQSKELSRVFSNATIQKHEFWTPG